MEFDDTQREAVMHIGTPLFAALLAAGEESDVPGADFVTAAVAGYEIAAKLGKAHVDRVHLRGFHPTATTGIFGASAAAGRLLRLTQAQTEDALGLDLSLAAGTQQFADGGGANKPLQVGMTAHNALLALRFAQAGLPGTRRPLEGRLGYYATFAEPGSDLEGIRFDGPPCEVLGVGMKPYPCCRYSHGAIDGLIGLVKQVGLEPGEIESMEIELPPAGYQLVGADAATKRRPRSIVEAQFSAYFGAAVAISDGAYSWDSYARLNDWALQPLMDIVTVVASDELADMETRLRVVSRRGAWSLDVPLPKGEPEKPLSWDDVESKFRSLGRHVFDDGRLREIIARVREVEKLSRLTELTRLLRA
jgi:2-methylcitrate dehydratase PrpD